MFDDAKFNVKTLIRNKVLSMKFGLVFEKMLHRKVGIVVFCFLIWAVSGSEKDFQSFSYTQEYRWVNKTAKTEHTLMSLTGTIHTREEPSNKRTLFVLDDFTLKAHIGHNTHQIGESFDTAFYVLKDDKDSVTGVLAESKTHEHLLKYMAATTAFNHSALIDHVHEDKYMFQAKENVGKFICDLNYEFSKNPVRYYYFVKLEINSKDCHPIENEHFRFNQDFHAMFRFKFPTLDLAALEELHTIENFAFPEKHGHAVVKQELKFKEIAHNETLWRTNEFKVDLPLEEEIGEPYLDHLNQIFIEELKKDGDYETIMILGENLYNKTDLRTHFNFI